MTRFSGTSVAVLGGGIGGMVSALDLAQAGLEVSLYEQSAQLGGLGASFEYEGHAVERFYHCIMPSDTELLSLIEDLGLTPELYWRHTEMSLIWGSRHYRFCGPIDLLRFDGIPLAQRLRLGAMSVLLPWTRVGRDLDRVSMEEWLRPLMGRELWQRFWRPMFEAKFGDAVADLPALYLFERLRREKNVGSRGYLRCGHRGLIDRLEERLKDLGVEILRERPLRSLQRADPGFLLGAGEEQNRPYDAVFSTLPPPVLGKIEGNEALGADVVKDAEMDYQGVVVAVMFLRRPLAGYYWTPVLHSDVSFDGVVEMSTLVDPRQLGGHHLAYVMRYCRRSSQLFAEDAESIASRWKREFLALYSCRGITESDIVSMRVFKAPFVEPIYAIGFQSRAGGHGGNGHGADEPGRNEPSAAGSSFFQATTAQVYPRITAWNSSIESARAIASRAAVALGASS